MLKKPLLDFQNVSLEKPGGKDKILDNVSFTVDEGDFVVLLGTNGSGKSTLMKMLNRQYSPSNGRVLFNDKAIAGYSKTDLCQQVVTLTQDVRESTFGSLTILENCLLAEMKMKNSYLSIPNSQDASKLVDYLCRFNPKLKTRLNVPVSHLSGGERQALGLAMCLMYPPKVLLLDEHTSALDPKTGDEIMSLTYEYVSSRGITVIMTTHNLDHVLRYGNKIITMKLGKMVSYINKSEHQPLNREQLFSMCY